MPPETQPQAAESKRIGFPPLTTVIPLLIVLAFVLAPGAVLDKANWIASGVCHRLGEHSFWMGGRQLPLCARCTGTYLGAVLGLTVAVVTRRHRTVALPPLPVLATLVGFIGLLAVDGFNSYLHFFPTMPHLYQPSNLLRLITGMLNGLALSQIVLPVFNFTLWEGGENRPVLRRLCDLGLLLIPAAGLVYLVQTQAAFLLYPVAIVSVLGVLIMLTLVNTMIVLIITRRESQAHTWREAVPSLLWGLAVTFLELSALNMVRFLVLEDLGGLVP